MTAHSFRASGAAAHEDGAGEPLSARALPLACAEAAPLPVRGHTLARHVRDRGIPGTEGGGVAHNRWLWALLLPTQECSLPPGTRVCLPST